MSKVSVVLPTYNRATTLARAIDSVLGQTDADFELIIVDDGSTDETQALLKDYCDPRIRVVRLGDNRGASAARNAGIKHAQYELIAFQDSDDRWYQNKLATLLSQMDPDTGVIYSDMDRIAKNGQTWRHHSPQIKDETIVNEQSKAYCVEGIGIVSCLIKKEHIDAAGGFNESLPALEDLELLIRLSRICRFQHVSAPLMAYYENDGQMSDAMRVAQSRRMILSLHKESMHKSKWFIAHELMHCHKLETKQVSPYR